MKQRGGGGFGTSYSFEKNPAFFTKDSCFFFFFSLDLFFYKMVLVMLLLVSL